MPVPLAALPLLLAASPVLAASPLPADGFVPFTSPEIQSIRQDGGTSGEVETFDPIARARLIAEQMPRRWSGRYQSFSGGPVVPVQLRIDGATPMGQMVDLRGAMAIGGVESAVQGNLNAKSDQLDLLVLGDPLGGALEPGGAFQSVQGLSLSGWRAPRLTTPGGRLQLIPESTAARPAGPAAGESPVRGLW
ncbi:hypothetical protein KBZ12_16975 [Cyanobium sp. Cruz CV13-4-11]|jgi:hypothetical protein|uniref:hypothetical protein n=1 Tax=unclassified Cyanobium TaxID=2627006 RepID=UPI0020CCCAF7|nr:MULTISPECIES: hypothetical protein [unclassified Cyanobium]MCP9902291.1 hypothetical protein [Cyanobium sp. Cruz CV11-17]MCP9921141.1 hypothetical protein [Cyanobium sp. Cruz CV13-4-11]